MTSLRQCLSKASAIQYMFALCFSWAALVWNMQNQLELVGHSPMQNMLGFWTRKDEAETTAPLHFEKRLLPNGTCHESPCGDLSVLPPFLNGTDRPTSELWETSLMIEKPNAAYCYFNRSAPFAGHLPHQMQQLYRCWSYWQKNPNKQPVLLGTMHVGSSFMRGLLVAWKSLIRLEHETKNDTIQRFLPYSIRPFVEPIYSMATPNDARSLSGVLLPPKVQSICPSQLRIGILNRQKSRRLLNGQNLVEQLHLALSDTAVVVDANIAYFENATFADQSAWFAAHDIVITPHGAQLSGLAWMPECGGVLEIFPFGYYLPKYFGSLAQSAGLLHGSLYLSDGDGVGESQAMRAQHRVDEMRAANLCPPINPVVKAVKTLLEHHQRCCSRRLTAWVATAEPRS